MMLDLGPFSDENFDRKKWVKLGVPESPPARLSRQAPRGSRDENPDGLGRECGKVRKRKRSFWKHVGVGLRA
ncbi:hypothetical protein RchiOBHm_Chr1g0374301 [Rosa chinensis]|uniref:Uncharacterized protein n=1 Tax=Rosa chinensis TaxID=74649 RepID=A0A2P6SMC4_ROSCH|nr:hypothetical protein RchiOBHm_Chr1g0374301 [Rosa chinensis]